MCGRVTFGPNPISGNVRGGGGCFSGWKKPLKATIPFILLHIYIFFSPFWIIWAFFDWGSLLTRNEYYCQGENDSQFKSHLRPTFIIYSILLVQQAFLPKMTKIAIHQLLHSSLFHSFTEWKKIAEVFFFLNQLSPTPQLHLVKEKRNSGEALEKHGQFSCKTLNCHASCPLCRAEKAPIDQELPASWFLSELAISCWTLS